MDKHSDTVLFAEATYSNATCIENAWHGDPTGEAGPQPYCPRHYPALYAMYDSKHRKHVDASVYDVNRQKS